MMVRNPDTGLSVKLFPTEEYNEEIQAFYAAVCQHTGSKELRIRTFKNGAEHRNYQCLVCGEPVGQNVPKSSPSAEPLRHFDESLVEKYRVSRASAENVIIRKHIKLQSSQSGRFSKEYKEYLASEQWAAKRLKVMKRAGNLCEGCRDNLATEVHHLSYEHLFGEFLFELVALCHDCHDRWHQDTEAPQNEELPCCACRFQAELNDSTPWCGKFDLVALKALSSEGQCGPNHASLEPLK